MIFQVEITLKVHNIQPKAYTVGLFSVLRGARCCLSATVFSTHGFSNWEGPPDVLFAPSNVARRKRSLHIVRMGFKEVAVTNNLDCSFGYVERMRELLRF